MKPRCAGFDPGLCLSAPGLSRSLHRSGYVAKAEQCSFLSSVICHFSTRLGSGKARAIASGKLSYGAIGVFDIPVLNEHPKPAIPF
jgi:hypothetical protein